MANWINVQGTKSGAGKSLVTTLVIRILAQNHSVAPFKPLNFSRNAFPVENSEIGYSTFHQARAAGIEPEKKMAPILVKPMEDKTELIADEGVEETAYEELDGKVGRKYEYIIGCIERLDEKFDYVVSEGFGSMINSNLENNPNIDLMEEIGGEVILVGDISEGGIEAQIMGTHKLLPEESGQKISLNIINKASREAENLAKTEKFIEEVTGSKTISLPYIHNLNFPEEDGVPDFSGSGEIAVINYPHISNTSDLELLPEEKTVLAEKSDDLEDANLVILPGSKNTLKDMKWMKEKSISDKIVEKSENGAVVFGICGGLQMLGDRIKGNDIEEGEVEGLGIATIETDFSDEKTLEQVEYSFQGEDFSGYRIHYGDSILPEENLFELESGKEGFFENDVGGTYIHDSLRNRKFLKWLMEKAGVDVEFSGNGASELEEILKQEVDFL